MTSYDELAQRVVALGYGIKTKITAGHHSWWVYSYNQTAEEFCNDGRTVMAMMDKTFPNGCIVARRGGISLAVAILIFCCDELEGEK